MAGRLRWRGLRAESVDNYSGVLVPLDEAHLHSHSARCGRTEFEELPAHGDEDDDPKDRAGDEGTGMLEMSAAEYSIEGLRKEVRRGGSGMRSDYELKSMLVNKAVQDIGMGRYNWQLFVLCGFGWFADNLWMQVRQSQALPCGDSQSHGFTEPLFNANDSKGVSLILPSLSAEFGVAEKTVRYTTSAVYLGLCFGSFTWGVGSDVLGRRIAFNMTLLITSVFGIMTAFATSWAWVCIFFSLLGFGVGGNLPVDGALFLEFLPDTSSSLLTLLSVWWPVGQLCSSFIAWFFIGNWPADRGWRLFVLAIGLITFGMFCLRFFIFHLFESPKYLLSRGRQSEAVAVVHGLAFRNGAKTWLSEAVLDAVVDSDDGGDEIARRRGHAAVSALSTKGVIKAKLDEFSGARIRPLFSSRKLGLATALVWFTWATIGMGYPLFNAFLPQYLSHTNGGGDSSSSTPPRESDPTDPINISAETYRNYAILSVVGVPGSILAYFTVDSKSAFLGRKGTLAISTFISASFLFLFVNYGTTSASQLAFSCVEAFSQNIMYGVLYAFTPEIFPAPVRGAGTGVASFLNRFTGLIAPILAANIPGDGASAPIYLSGALIFAAFVGIVLIPIETRGRQRL